MLRKSGENACHLLLLLLLPGEPRDPPGPAGGARPSQGKQEGRHAGQQTAHSPLQVVPHNHLLQLHDVRMAEAKEQRDLSKAADGDPCNPAWPQRPPPLQTGSPRPASAPRDSRPHRRQGSASSLGETRGRPSEHFNTSFLHPAPDSSSGHRPPGSAAALEQGRALTTAAAKEGLGWSAGPWSTQWLPAQARLGRARRG